MQKFDKENVTLPTEMVQNIIKYCEDKQVYDKLGAYGDFYYKLKRIVDKR